MLHVVFIEYYQSVSCQIITSITFQRSSLDFMRLINKRLILKICFSRTTLIINSKILKKRNYYLPSTVKFGKYLKCTLFLVRLHRYRKILKLKTHKKPQINFLTHQSTKTTLPSFVKGIIIVLVFQTSHFIMNSCQNS